MNLREAVLVEDVAELGAVADAAQLDPEHRAVAAISALGTYATSAIQPRGLLPRTRPLPRPRPTAGGYSSRSSPARVGTASSSRLRRASAPGRLSTSTDGQPALIAASACLRMWGYAVAEKLIDCTPVGL